MNAALLLEILVAVSLQVGLLLSAAVWLERRVPFARRDRFWHFAHVLALGLVVQGLLLPHVRWMRLPQLLSSESLSAWQQASEVIAWGVICIWIAGMALHFAFMLWGSLRSRRRLRDATDFPELTSMLRAEHPQSAFARRHGVVRLAQGSVGSHCWHWQRPVIVLSRRAQSLPLESQRLILRHELAHLEAGHPLHVFAQQILRAFLWFHPLVWWTSRRAELAREIHCDSLLSADHAEEYLTALLALNHSSTHQVHAPALAFNRDRSLLKARLAAFADASSSSSANRFVCPTLFVLTIALIAFAWPPVNPQASSRTMVSPWPAWSATALKSLGVSARDYETDSHRLRRHH